MSTLRPNQVPAHKIAVDFFSQANPEPSIIVAPTAFGKSHLIAHVTNDIVGKTLILQPTKELLQQNYEKFTLLGGYAAIYSASAGIKRFGNVMYATIGSIKGLGEKFKALGFENLIIDEVHLYPRSVESMLGNFLAESGIHKVLGLTATPFKLQSNTDMNGERFSKLQMLTSLSKASASEAGKVSRFFKDIIYVSQIQEMIELNFWSKLEYELHEFEEVGLDWNSAKSDYTDDSLKYNYENQQIEAKIIDRLRSLDRKSVIIFVPSIADAISLADQLPNAAAVHSKLKDAERDDIIKGFRAGRIRYLVNVDIVSTGFDHTKVDCIVFGRKTASLAWFYQAAGRGTRIDPDKEDCLIIDFTGNVKRFGRLEFIYFKKKRFWQVYGEGGRLLTGIAMDQIGQVIDGPTSGVKMPFGKYKGTDISAIPRSYIDYMLREFTWTTNNQYIKDACQMVMAQAV